MDILVISDTHGHPDLVEQAVGRTRPQLVFFLGDGLSDLRVLDSNLSVCAVRGNCDFFRALDVPETRVEQIGAYRIFLTHGHRYGVKCGTEALILAAAREQADLVLYGHTHIPMQKWLPAGTRIGDSVLERDMTVLCPGSLGEGRDGLHAFATLTVRNNGILPALSHL